jgi:hypothetical protein
MRWRPSASDAVFLVVVAVALGGGHNSFLNDPGTFWHLRLGRDILQTGQLPCSDTLTTTRMGTPWVDQSWAFDILLAWVVDHAGWTGAVIAAALGLGAIYAALARSLVEDGITSLVAFVVAVLAAGIGSIHFLLRPHLFTFALVCVTLRVCREYQRGGGRSIWLVPALVAIWANLHGGFLAGPLIVLTAVAGHVATRPWDAAWRCRLQKLCLVFALSCYAPLLNPYGVGLLRHVAGLLHHSRVTDLIEEYQPSPFGRPQARVLEWVILALVGLPAVAAFRPRRTDMAQALVWLHLALTSIRHAPLFGFAVAPVLACGLQALCRRPGGWIDDRCEHPPPSAGRTGKRGEDANAGPASVQAPRSCSPGEGAGWPLWPAVVSSVVVMAALSGRLAVAPDPARWPLEGLRAVDRLPVEVLLFHEQDWGGLIESECRPRRRAFLDDRFELWGREPIREYISALQGGPGWDAILARHPIRAAWLKPDRGLTRRLVADPGWRVVFRDRTSVLMRRGGPGHEPRPRRLDAGAALTIE